MQDARERLATLVRERIPLTAHMGLELVALGPRHAATSSPLAANRNVHGSAFAGSLYAQSAVTAWVVITHWLENEGYDADLIQRSGHIDYRAPVTGPLACRCVLDDDTMLAGFRARYDEVGRARLTAHVAIAGDGGDAATFTGEFTATRRG